MFPDRTFIADYPAFVLNASWVSQDEADAANRFLGWLDTELDADAVLDQQFRLGDPWDGIDDRAPAGADLSQEWAPLPIPSGETLSAVQDAWAEVRKPANVLILLEKGNMHVDSKIDSAKQRLRAFIRGLPDGVTVGLDSFDEEVVVEAAPRALDEQHEAELLSALDGIRPHPGESFLADALMQSIDKVDDPNGIAVIVLVSLGVDRDDGRWTLDDALAKLTRLSGRTSPVQVFTVSFGIRTVIRSSTTSPRDRSAPARMRAPRETVPISARASPRSSSKTSLRSSDGPAR